MKNIFSKNGLIALGGLDLPSTDKNLLKGLLKIYGHLEERIKDSDGLVEKLYSELREAQLISTVAHVKKVVYESEKYFVIDSNFKGRIIL